MTDISDLQSEWLNDVKPLADHQKKFVDKEQGALEKINNFNKKYDGAHGFKRLTKSFLEATKRPWLRNKEFRAANHKNTDDTQIKNLADSKLSKLADAVARDSINADEFKYLETAISQIRDVQNKVKKAANKCRNASIAEGAAAVGDAVPIIDTVTTSDNDNPGAALIVMGIAAAFKAATSIGGAIAASRATRALRNAEEEVQSLQKELQQEMPKVNGNIANDISWSNNMTLMMDAIGGLFATYSNMDMAQQLNGAKNHLHDVADKLGNVMNTLAQEKQVIADAALKQARTTDSDIEKFAAQLELFKKPLEERAKLEMSMPEIAFLPPLKKGFRLIKRNNPA
jgi:hypothetical protein